MENICIKCKEEPVFIKKRKLCRKCYQQHRKESDSNYVAC